MMHLLQNVFVVMVSTLLSVQHAVEGLFPTFWTAQPLTLTEIGNFWKNLFILFVNSPPPSAFSPTPPLPLFLLPPPLAKVSPLTFLLMFVLDHFQTIWTKKNHGIFDFRLDQMVLYKKKSKWLTKSRDIFQKAISSLIFNVETSSLKRRNA